MKLRKLTISEIVAIMLLLAVTAAIGLPLLTSAKSSTRRSTCVNNLKQLGMVLGMYAAENGDRFPPIDDTKNNFMFDANFLYPEYLTDPTITMCPASRGFDPKTFFRLRSNGQHPYSYVGEIHPDCITGDSYTYLGFVVLNNKDTEMFFKLYDDLSLIPHEKEAYALQGPGGSASLPLVWDKPTTKPEGLNHKDGRKEGGNVLFLDGHVEYRQYPHQFPISETMARLLDEHERTRIPDCDDTAGEKREVARRFDHGTIQRLGLSTGVDRFFITDTNQIFTGREAGGGPPGPNPHFKVMTPEEIAAASAAPAERQFFQPARRAVERNVPDGFDEVWVIEQPARSESTSPDASARGRGGELNALVGGHEIPLPLEHTDVQANISAFVSTVKVTQNFGNPYDTKIEAVYVFPLPHDAAVTEFVMTIGERRILGLIREREEAQQIYLQARADGYVASLLTQERPNVFTQRVANIEPGKNVDVQTTYFGLLAYHDGEYEFAFPMVVGPRFNPPGKTDGIGAVVAGKAGASGQKTELQYLKPEMVSGHDISLEVDVEAGVDIEDIYSRTHEIAVNWKSPTHAVVALNAQDHIPNRDFVLRYKVAGERLKTAMLVNRGKNGGVFALVLQPPADLKNLPRVPREMVFVLDCSGSMEGRPLAKAKEAMRHCLNKLDSNDSFQLVRFSDDASALGSSPIRATRLNVLRGLAYLEMLRSEGGTMMIEGVQAALDFPHDPGRLRIVSFMTDGYIGNEAEILAAIEEKIGSARIFSFGVGTSVNRYLLEGMARVGRGAVAYVNLNDPATEAVDLFYERASRPALADIEVDWGSLRVSDIYPPVLPDVFVGRPVLITGRFEGEAPATIQIRGKAGTEERSFTIDVDPKAAEAEHPGIESIWARWKLRDLSDQEVSNPSEQLRREIIETSLAYHLLCQYTGFVAVDESERTAGGEGVSVAIPVPVPESVRYETTVQE